MHDVQGFRWFSGWFALTLLFLTALALAGPSGTAWAQTAESVAEPSPTGGNVPGGHLGTTSDAGFWGQIRQGLQGNVSIPDKQAGQMIQSEGESWRSWRNGPLTVWGGTALLIMIGAIALFFLIRGRIRIESGPSGRTIERFNELERFTHWLTAVCFVVLALTGLNLLYGKHVLLPVLGPTVFAFITMAGKYAHNYLAFGFMLGVILMFVLWIRHNIPNKHDLQWLAQGGGLFKKGVHPPSKKFNAGQKLIFWSVILGGLLLSLSGIALLFPFQFPLFADTFAILNVFGFNMPTTVTAMQEMQLAQSWHAIVGVALIAVIIGHIYIGSLGMEGAFDAMGTGQVDENWAREHHNLWVAEMKGEAPGAGHGKAQPAE